MANEPLKFTFIFNEHSLMKFQERFTVEVWCDGRKYIPEDEAYRPVYSYKIVANDGEWEYVSDDIFGDRNEQPDTTAGAKSLFAFLIAAQEGLPEDIEGKRDGAEIFPPHVREFAYLLKEEIMTKYVELERKLEKK